jgi:hypothetical protein
MQRMSGEYDDHQTRRCDMTPTKRIEEGIEEMREGIAGMRKRLRTDLRKTARAVGLPTLEGAARQFCKRAARAAAEVERNVRKLRMELEAGAAMNTRPRRKRGARR